MSFFNYCSATFACCKRKDYFDRYIKASASCCCWFKNMPIVALIFIFRCRKRSNVDRDLEALWKSWYKSLPFMKFWQSTVSIVIKMFLLTGWLADEIFRTCFKKDEEKSNPIIVWLARVRSVIVVDNQFL